MKPNQEHSLWVPNSVTYSEIQHLKLFVDIVANSTATSETNKQKLKEIKFLIEHINNPKTFKNWYVCLDIFDRKLQSGIAKGGGVYWRKWWVFFEDNQLSITAETNHTNEHLGHYGNDFNYAAFILFKESINGQRVFMKKSIAEFVADAKNYKTYRTETLNAIEIDIDILEP